MTVLKRAGLAALAWMLACVLPAPGHAQQTVYQWKDASGTTHFSATPPPRGKARKIVLQGDTPTSGAVPQSAPPESKAKPAPTSELYQVEAAYRQQSCQAARHDLSLLESGKMVIQGDRAATARKLNAAGREKARAEAKARIARFCLDAHEHK